MRRSMAAAFLLAAVTLAVYLPLTRAGFIYYDDDRYVTGNAVLGEGFTPRGLGWALTTMHQGNWHPLTWLSHMLDVRLFGMRAGGHHLTSVVIHAAGAALLLVVLAGMTGSLPAGALAAGLFALHPLHVESVAWVAERKDVLAGFFWMLALAGYARYVRAPSWRRYPLVLVPFLLGLMAKPMVVTLPFVLLLLDWWPLGRVGTGSTGTGTAGAEPVGRPGVHGAALIGSTGTGTAGAEPVPLLLLEKLPLFLFAAASAAVTWVAQARFGTVGSLEVLGLPARLANAVVAYAVYVRKTFWPGGLAVFYPHPMGGLPWWAVWGAGLFLLGVTLAAVLTRRRAPYLAVGWFWYLGTLVPVIGLVQVGEQSMADRYTYLPLVGLFLAAAAGLARAAAGGRGRCRFLAPAALAALAVLAVLSRRQAGFWRDSEALFSHALRVTRGNWVAYNNLGMICLGRGRYEEAADRFREAIGANDGYWIAHNNLGLAFVSMGRYEEAAARFREAMEINPDYQRAYGNLGVVRLRQRRLTEAVAHLTDAVRLDPGDADARFNLGMAEEYAGRDAEAARCYREALAINPGDGEARGRLARIMAKTGSMH